MKAGCWHPWQQRPWATAPPLGACCGGGAGRYACMSSALCPCCLSRSGRGAFDSSLAGCIASLTLAPPLSETCSAEARSQRPSTLITSIAVMQAVAACRAVAQAGAAPRSGGRRVGAKAGKPSSDPLLPVERPSHIRSREDRRPQLCEQREARVLAGGGGRLHAARGSARAPAGLQPHGICLQQRGGEESSGAACTFSLCTVRSGA